jgi:hypothetical protein
MPDVQFLQPNWKRRCLIRLGAKHGLFLENGKQRGQLGDAFVFLRVTDEVRTFFREAARFLETLLTSSRLTEVDSFSKLVYRLPPELHGCKFDLFPRDEVHNTATPVGGLKWLFHIVIHSVECVSNREAKRMALRSAREAFQKVTEALRKSNLKD